MTPSFSYSVVSRNLWRDGSVGAAIVLGKKLEDVPRNETCRDGASRTLSHQSSADPLTSAAELEGMNKSTVVA
jgi:hypothetical protein